MKTMKTIAEVINAFETEGITSFVAVRGETQLEFGIENDGKRYNVTCVDPEGYAAFIPVNEFDRYLQEGNGHYEIVS